VINGHTKSVIEVVEELRDELIEFLTTRCAMLEAEFDEKARAVKMLGPVLGIGVLVLTTAWLLFTGFLVIMIAQAFAPNAWRFALSFLVVAVLYSIVGGVAAYVAWLQLKEKGVKPERILRVLKQDGLWLQTEAKERI
jgi:uncharacterized membrane protein YqjE